MTRLGIPHLELAARLGHTKFLRKYAAFSLLVIDEWLLDHPDDDMRAS